MEEILRFLEKYEAWVYIISGGVALIWVRKMMSAWRDLRNAVFGLEREIANRRFASAMSVIALLILFNAVEFILVSFVTPGLPSIEPLLTPTLSAGSTQVLPTAIAADGTQLAPSTTQAAPAALEVNGTPAAGSDGCKPGQIEWLSPKPDEEISGSVKLEGTVNLDNFGFYKYEYSQSGSETWTTIAAGSEKKIEGELGTWNTSVMPVGDYLLRLVVVDNQNQPYAPCVLPVTITAPQE
jgi:hypothetical protein